MNPLNSYFDKIYVLNLKSRPDRLDLMSRRLQFFGVDFEVFNAIPGNSLPAIYDNLKEPHSFTNPNYLASNLSHLAIYSEALSLGYTNILILEDDLRVHRQLNSIFSDLMERDRIVNSREYDLLYLAFIPVKEDGIRWDYSLIDNSFITKNVVKASNLWSLMAYGIQKPMMEFVLDYYSKSISQELDRFFVTSVQKTSKKCFGVLPQLFAGDNVLSDNDGKIYNDMLHRSVDKRFALLEDYI